MSSRTTIVTRAALCLTAALAPGLLAAPAAQARDTCGTGHVCIFESNGTILAQNEFSYAGTHLLRNVYGYHHVENNQTGGWGYQYCYDSKCKNHTGPFARDSDPDLTPVNAIYLFPPGKQLK